MSIVNRDMIEFQKSFVAGPAACVSRQLPRQTPKTSRFTLFSVKCNLSGVFHRLLAQVCVWLRLCREALARVTRKISLKTCEERVGNHVVDNLRVCAINT